jgi:hypothetical protein
VIGRGWAVLSGDVPLIHIKTTCGPCFPYETLSAAPSLVKKGVDPQQAVSFDASLSDIAG